MTIEKNYVNRKIHEFIDKLESNKEDIDTNNSLKNILNYILTEDKLYDGYLFNYIEDNVIENAESLSNTETEIVLFIIKVFLKNMDDIDRLLEPLKEKELKRFNVKNKIVEGLKNIYTDRKLPTILEYLNSKYSYIKISVDKTILSFYPDKKEIPFQYLLAEGDYTLITINTFILFINIDNNDETNLTSLVNEYSSILTHCISDNSNLLDIEEIHAILNCRYLKDLINYKHSLIRLDRLMIECIFDKSLYLDNIILGFLLDAYTVIDDKYYDLSKRMLTYINRIIDNSKEDIFKLSNIYRKNILTFVRSHTDNAKEIDKDIYLKEVELICRFIYSENNEEKFNLDINLESKFFKDYDEKLIYEKFKKKITEKFISCPNILTSLIIPLEKYGITITSEIFIYSKKIFNENEYEEFITISLISLIESGYNIPMHRIRKFVNKYKFLYDFSNFIILSICSGGIKYTKNLDKLINSIVVDSDNILLRDIFISYISKNVISEDQLKLINEKLSNTSNVPIFL